MVSAFSVGSKPYRPLHRGRERRVDGRKRKHCVSSKEEGGGVLVKRATMISVGRWCPYRVCSILFFTILLGTSFILRVRF